MRTITLSQLRTRVARLERSKRTPAGGESADCWALLAGLGRPVSAEQQARYRAYWLGKMAQREPCPYETRLAEERAKVEAYLAQQASLPCGLVELPPKQEAVQTRSDEQPATCALLALIR
jgi:hypothetical protein